MKMRKIVNNLVKTNMKKKTSKAKVTREQIEQEVAMEIVKYITEGQQMFERRHLKVFGNRGFDEREYLVILGNSIANTMIKNYILARWRLLSELKDRKTKF